MTRSDAACGDGFTVERPTGSSRMLTLGELSRRMVSLFLPDEGRRRCHGAERR